MKSIVFDYFDAIYCINLDRRKDRWELVKKELEKMNIMKRVTRFPAFDVKEKHVGCALSHCNIIKIAKENNYNNILVLEDDIFFNDNKYPLLEKSINDLRKKRWDIFYLGVSLCLNDIPYALKDNNLLSIAGARSTHAIAYSKNIYNELLDTLPASIESGIKFTQKYLAIDAFYAKHFQMIHKIYMPLENICYQQVTYSDNEKKMHDLGRHQMLYFFLFKQGKQIQKMKKILHKFLYYFIWH